MTIGHRPSRAVANLSVRRLIPLQTARNWSPSPLGCVDNIGFAVGLQRRTGRKGQSGGMPRPEADGAITGATSLNLAHRALDRAFVQTGTPFLAPLG
jgi:hypothetical protein